MSIITRIKLKAFRTEVFPPQRAKGATKLQFDEAKALLIQQFENFKNTYSGKYKKIELLGGFLKPGVDGFLKEATLIPITGIQVEGQSFPSSFIKDIRKNAIKTRKGLGPNQMIMGHYINSNPKTGIYGEILGIDWQLTNNSECSRDIISLNFKNLNYYLYETIRWITEFRIF